MRLLLIISSFVVLNLLFVEQGSAQFDCIFEHISTEKGLSHGSVSGMLKDQKGFMWFSTWDGINRYDGQTFKTYKPSNSENGSSASNRIEWMKEDSLGNIWVMTYDSKLFRLNRCSEQFALIPNEKNTAKIKGIYPASSGDVWVLTYNEGVYCIQSDPGSNAPVVHHFDSATQPALPGNQLSFVAEDPQQFIWIGTDTGLIRLAYDSLQNQFEQLIFSEEIQQQFNKVAITAFASSDASVYLGTANSHLLEFKSGSGELKDIQLNTTSAISYLTISSEGLLFAGTTTDGVFECNPYLGKVEQHYQHASIQSVLKMFPDSKGNIWVESRKAGISKIDPANKSFRHYEQRLNVKQDLRSMAQCGFMEDRDHTVWMTLKGGGFGFYNATSDEVEYFYNEPGNPASKVSNFVNCFYKDPSGVLWMSTYFKGLEKVTFVQQKFHQLQPAPKNNLSLENEVRALLEDSQGLLWLATKNQEIFLLSQQYKVVHKIDQINGKKIGLVYAMLEDSKGNIYLGTKGNGLFQLHRKGKFSFNATHYLNNKSDSLSLSSNNIYSILEDKKGRLWIGTYGGGVNLKLGDHFLNAGNILKTYPIEQGFKVRHLAEDSQGHIWMGTTNGLVCLPSAETPDNFTFKFYNADLGNASGLKGKDVFWIFSDQTNNLWMATLGGGLAHLKSYDEGNSIGFSSLTADDGLPSDVIFAITQDENNILWMSTENGIASFDPAHHVFRNYNRYDGILSSGFSEAAVAKRSDGSICFGSNNGIYWFYPNQVESAPTNIPLEFTGFKLSGKEVVPGDSSVLQKSISVSTALRLKNNQNSFGITWAALDYKMQDKIQYDFMLDGYETNWHSFSDQTKVNYTKIPPGEYVFRVRFSSPELQSVNPERHIALEILPPLWQTTWAYIIYLILTIFLIELARRIITSMIRLRNKVVVEKELSNLKLNFFTNISHELRTPLTLILGPVKELASKEKLSEKGTTHVQLIEHNANRLLRLVNQLLDFRKIESKKMELELAKVNVSEFLQEVCSNFNELAAEKQIRFKFLRPKEAIFIVFDEEKMESVLSNLLSNAFKFTSDGGAVEVSLSKEEELLEIVVCDHGAGVSKEQENTLFDVFVSSAKNEEGKPQGTGIGLALSKQLVDLHGGSLNYKPTPGGGATFSILLKLDKTLQIADLNDEQFVVENQYRLENGSNQIAASLPQILIVEDNPELRQFLRLQLEEAYQISEAPDGKAGWELALKLQPELIISDVMMPVMDGIQLLDKLKNNSDTSHIPVLLLTAKSSVESKIEGLKYGADAYMTKPFNNEQLKAQLNNLLQQRVLLRQRYLKQSTSLEAASEFTITDHDAVFLKNVSEIIEKNLSNSEFKLADIYKQIGMGRSKFYDKVKGLTGLSPIEFVMELRLNKAHELLMEGAYNVSETSYMSGFTDAGYFSKCFKERFGVSPSQVGK